jgi:DNA (cytosine-5)-methyltransferase 3A
VSQNKIDSKYNGGFTESIGWYSYSYSHRSRRDTFFSVLSIMKVVSLFDGISCLRVALGERDVEYIASEVDSHAIKISKKNYPLIKHIGDVCKVGKIEDVDLLCGGSPCTDLSISKKNRKGLEGEKSGLFWEWVRVWKLCKPKYWILENVNSMPRKDRDIISLELGVEPLMIDASLVSAQSRKRLFWTNISVKGLPVDRGILLKVLLACSLVPRVLFLG